MSDPGVACFDIDGVLAAGGPEVYGVSPPRYDLCSLIEHTRLVLVFLRAHGVNVILHSSRWEVDRLVTEAWLRKHDVPYDRLVLGKPKADVYVDDRSFPLAYPAGFSDAAERILTTIRWQQVRNGKGP